ncbi:hypothetical protein AQZ52_04365 [Novosphingobium fuchskuhlense]|uniref:Uncharacterized protein n=1 Tax=Novosphingobium fuchskuhlense TaxID=1117702 RepID=A0A117UX61_9SPHN|nr:hypothetical protein [Novosphingobium fuchskuhlense]KUR72486.1 hypothetical protein AQZ52_04365 [Novosphingobium fuchskuhlense]
MKGPVISRRKAMAGMAGAGGALGASFGPVLAQDSLAGGRTPTLLLIDARQTDPATLAMVEQLYPAQRYEVLGQEPVRAWRDGLEAAVRKAGATHVIGRWDTVYVLSMLGREASLRMSIRQLGHSTFCLTLSTKA